MTRTGSLPRSLDPPPGELLAGRLLRLTSGSACRLRLSMAGVEDQLRPLRAEPGVLTTGQMPEYLFRRTDGIVGLLERLIEDAYAEAISTGEEQVTAGFPDGIPCSLGNVPGRDDVGGEVPPVPEHPPASRKQRRPCNTASDDQGTPGAPAS